MIDHYPSRKKSEIEIIRRTDPVIYSERSQVSETPLTEEQLDSYEQNGFLFLENFFSEAEVEDMKNQIFSLKNAHKHTEKAEIIREPDSDEIRSILDVHRGTDYFKQLSESQKLQDITNYLLGSDTYIHQSRVNYKPGFTGKEFDWHSDFETWHVEDGMPRMRAISVSIALSDNYSFNGPLMLIPGSHQHFISCLGETPDNHFKESLKQQKLGVPDNDSLTCLVNQNGISVPTGKAGSVLLFECNTMHGSNGNITPFDRNNLFFVFNSVENRLVEPFSGGKPRPEFIANREQVAVHT